VDHVVAEKFDADRGEVTEDENIPPSRMALDIGPRTVEFYSQPIAGAATIFCHGPMGVFENPAFSRGTFGIAKAIAGSKATKLAGGGDVSAALAASGYESAFDFVSTGGGATLEFLEGKVLPGLKALALSQRPS